MSPHRLWPVLLLLLLPALAGAQPATPTTPPPSAPWLGDDTYTVSMSGPLRKVLDQLGKLTNHQFTLPHVQNAAGQWEEQGGDTPVKLDADNATLGQILVLLGKQAGFVFDAPEAGYNRRFVTLRVGDPQLDLRPAVQVGDYVLRMVNVTLTTNRSDTFAWGQRPPDKPDVQTSLSFRLEVTAYAADAARKLAGLGTSEKIVPDQGDPVTGGQKGPSGYYMPFWSSIEGEARTMATQLNCPAPPAAATKLLRLEGNLVLFSTVRVTEMKLAPNAPQTYTQDDVSATVKSWTQQGNQLTVDIGVKRPPLPSTTAFNYNPGNRDLQVAALVAQDGREVPGMIGGSWNPGTSFNLSFIFLLPPSAPEGPGAAGPANAVGPFVPDYLRLTFIRRANADVTLPFVLTNIPLPAT